VLVSVIVSSFAEYIYVFIVTLIMQTASLAQLKKEIQSMPHAELVEVCARLIKYKKENKELLTYILFESGDETYFIESLKIEVTAMFMEVNVKSMHWAKKTIRKILRTIQKYGRYSGLPTTQIELLIHFCQQMKELRLDFTESLAMKNLHATQVANIKKIVATLHEDLQYDYKERIDMLVL